jgi:hypothetical protein
MGLVQELDKLGVTGIEVSHLASTPFRLRFESVHCGRTLRPYKFDTPRIRT